MQEAGLNNSAAAEILTGMISKGHAKQNQDGSVSVLNQLAPEPALFGGLDKDF